MSSVYNINRGINRPVEFKGLTAQYIWWLGGGLLALLFLFALMYIAGVAMVACVVTVVGSGCLLFRVVYTSSRKYGQHGLMKKMAAKSIPKSVKGSVIE